MGKQWPLNASMNVCKHRKREMEVEEKDIHKNILPSNAQGIEGDGLFKMEYHSTRNETFPFVVAKKILSLNTRAVCRNGTVQIQHLPNKDLHIEKINKSHLFKNE